MIRATGDGFPRFRGNHFTLEVQCGRDSQSAPHGALAQQVEARDSKSRQCGFDSHGRYATARRVEEVPRETPALTGLVRG